LKKQENSHTNKIGQKRYGILKQSSILNENNLPLILLKSAFDLNINLMSENNEKYKSVFIKRSELISEIKKEAWSENNIKK